MFAAAAPGGETGVLFIELGAVVLGLAFLARLSHRAGLSPIPLYLLAGLALGTGGLVSLDFSEAFVSQGAQIGVVLLLFMLGLEYSSEELSVSLRGGLPAGFADLVLNFTPGLIAGLLLGWSALAALILGGVTYISSSGVVAKLLADLDRVGNRETPAILTILVLEDLAMAVYLPLIAVLIVGAGLLTGALSLLAAVTTAVAALAIALRFGERVSRAVSSRSDEVVLLTVFGLILLVGGVAESLQVSSAVGAFLVGITLSGRVAEHARRLLEPLRDLFAATFFLFFGLQVDPRSIAAVAAVAVALGLVTALTKLATGWIAAGRIGVATRGRVRAGAALIARGEFSIVIAGLGVGAGLEPNLGTLAAAYVLLMAAAGPLVARVADPLGAALSARQAVAEQATE